MQSATTARSTSRPRAAEAARGDATPSVAAAVATAPIPQALGPAAVAKDPPAAALVAAPAAAGAKVERAALAVAATHAARHAAAPHAAVHPAATSLEWLVAAVAEEPVAQALALAAAATLATPAVLAMAAMAQARAKGPAQTVARKAAHQSARRSRTHQRMISGSSRRRRGDRMLSDPEPCRNSARHPSRKGLRVACISGGASTRPSRQPRMSPRPWHWDCTDYYAQVRHAHARGRTVRRQAAHGLLDPAKKPERRPCQPMPHTGAAA
mmetsp:Transcript_2161/g.5334  ORF Transcript_2161/g.5334 Transcript_2161/m.5334 type:complete len:268 (+) Transcript_2161:1385-2188(+)